MWACKVCGKDAEFIADVPTSKANKQGKYTIIRMGYCKKHKPNVWTIKEYTDAMKKVK